MSPRQQTFDELLRRWGTEEPPTLRSVNSLVGRNLTAARVLRGMTQEMLGNRLEEITGRPWSKATVSALERSADGVRVREFDADDLVAIAYALDVPLLFLFMPESREYHPHLRYAPRPVEGQNEPADDWTAVDLARVLVGAGDATTKVGTGEASAYVAHVLAELVGVDEFDRTGRLMTDATGEKLARWREALEEMAAEIAQEMGDRTVGGEQ